MTADATGLLWPDPDLIPEDPDDGFWTADGASPWPTWVSGFRSWQTDAVREIVDGYRRGARVMVVDAPTGAGKTLIGEMVRRAARTPTPTTYLSSTISLQDQFVRDFPYAHRIMGASNYPTEHGPPWVSGADCQGRECGLCDTFESCPYRQAKRTAVGGLLAVANTSYWLHETNHVPRDGLRARPGLIIDECDTMESALMGYVEVYVGGKWIDRARVGELKKGARRDTVTAWLTDLENGLTAWVKQNRRTVDVKKRREVKDAIRMVAKIVWFRGEWVRGGKEEGEGSVWIRDYPRDEWSPVVFRAVKVDRLAERNAWKWVGGLGLRDDPTAWLLGMSATVVSADEWIESNGLAELGVDWGKVVVPSPFAKENRPVVVLPIADMKMSTWEKDLPDLLRVVRNILERHPDDKVLIHTTSWKLNDAVLRGITGTGRAVITHKREDGAKGRERALERHKGARGGSVLVSPSMDRGVDLPGEDCRVQIVCKVPYPYLGNRQIKERTRLPGGQTWYMTQTARTIVQMTGRGVRSADDHATTYVLDRQFVRWYGDAKKLLPGWWVEAVKTGKVREFL